MTNAPTPAGMAVSAWLDEPESYGIRMERLVEDLENGADIVPWLEAVYNLAAQPSAGAEPVAWKAKAAVLRSRGKNNSLHDINQAADYLDQAASYTHPAPVLTAGVTRDQIMAVVRQYAAPAWCSVDRLTDALVSIMNLATPAQPDSGGVVEALREARETLDSFDCVLTTDKHVAVIAKKQVKRIDKALAALAPVAAEGGEIADGCGYTGHEFGAPYPDSTCIESYLWDLDSCDEPGGGLTSGGDIPCPKCNPEDRTALRTEPTGGGEG